VYAMHIQLELVLIVPPVGEIRGTHHCWRDCLVSVSIYVHRTYSLACLMHAQLGLVLFLLLVEKNKKNFIFPNEIVQFVSIYVDNTFACVAGIEL
jgi:hypothetical protein